MKGLFSGAGWKVFEAKYGTQLTAAMKASMALPCAAASTKWRTRNIRRSSASKMALSFVAVFPTSSMRSTARIFCASIADTPDDELQKLISNLGGHDLTELIGVFNEADAVEHSPAVIFAYTVKGWGLPMAGDPLNHSQLLNQGQMDILRGQNGLAESDMWDALAPDSPGGELCITSAGNSNT